MTWRVSWTDKAKEEYYDCLAIIAQDSPSAADLVEQRIQKAANELARKPLGRPGRYPETYEKSIPKTSMVLVYEKRGADSVNILRLIHTSRDWPRGGWPED